MTKITFDRSIINHISTKIFTKRRPEMKDGLTEASRFYVAFAEEAEKRRINPLDKEIIGKMIDSAFKAAQITGNVFRDQDLLVFPDGSRARFQVSFIPLVN